MGQTRLPVASFIPTLNPEEPDILQQGGARYLSRGGYAESDTV